MNVAPEAPVVAPDEPASAGAVVEAPAEAEDDIRELLSAPGAAAALLGEHISDAEAKAMEGIEAMEEPLPSVAAAMGQLEPEQP
eukprot:15124840-Alexandrium_andersonii.AAC.1